MKRGSGFIFFGVAALWARQLLPDLWWADALCIAAIVTAVAGYLCRPREAPMGFSPAMTPTAYEQYCAAILTRGGWSARPTGMSGDQGIDVIANKAGVYIVLQCKLYNQVVGNDAVQQAIAGCAYAGARYAAVVSNAAYTASARALAERTGVYLLHHSDLLDADRLFLARERV